MVGKSIPTTPLKLRSRLLSLCRHSLLFGSLVLSLPAMTSQWSTERLLGELAKLNHDSTVGIFFVKTRDLDADIIGEYLPSARYANACKERSISEEANCMQDRGCLPNIEFSKINPTKYRIKIFHACRNFNLIFSERFDPMWKSYITKTSVLNAPNAAIRNDKFSECRIWETWLSGNLELYDHTKSRDGKTLEPSKWRYSAGFNGDSAKWPDMFHWEANAFANGWFFDLQGIQRLPRMQNSQNGYYVQNSDGSVNFEVVIEYLPQRILYLAYSISLLSILLCLVTAICMKGGFKFGAQRA